jgi:redox-sensitive bicupin YhaK (pirin superfamily)
MSDPVLQKISLGPQWPTIDPFLFCAHHDDSYPKGNADLGPAAALEGRHMGMDFAGKDGWNMYHGTKVPGFPSHPHRGFETVTYVRKGLIDHADSLGAAARFGRGDVQWLTAGGGIQHSEMFPLLESSKPNPLELFQIWLNLPTADKLVDPYFTMLWGDELPRIVVGEPDSEAEITVIAGSVGGAKPPTPPPDSWAGRADSEVGIWHIALDPGASWELPVAASPATIRTLYVFDRGSAELSGHSESLPLDTGAVVTSKRVVQISSETGSEVMLLQGVPIGEPVAQQGPFVMNTEAEISAAFAEYRQTQFGGWPWQQADPVHPPEKGRFARHVDGRVEEPV